MFLVNPCFVNPCKNNATCQISGVTYICTCQAFYSGTNCQTCTLERKWSYFESLEFNFYYYTAVTNSCLSTPCLNGGQCTPTGTGSTYTCNCSGGYSGLNVLVGLLEPIARQVLWKILQLVEINNLLHW